MSPEPTGPDEDRRPTGAATKVIVDHVRPERRAEFERWENDINTAVADFDGYLGAQVFPPRTEKARGHHELEYVTIIHFDTAENLRAWEESPECRGWLAAAEDLIVDTETHTAQGIELWFSLPPRRRGRRPPVWKSVIVSSIAVYSLLLLLDEALTPLTDDLPDPLALAISVVVLSTLLTWPVLPYLTRAMAGWLYPADRDVTHR